MTPEELKMLREQNDWRPFHFIMDFQAVPVDLLEEFGELEQAKAARETTRAIFNMIESC